jgi:hypothetical protein
VLAGDETARTWYAPPDDANADYDAKLAETLKNRVIEVLRNAVNLRHLGPDDWIVVNIIGAPIPGEPLGRGPAAKAPLLRSDPFATQESEEPVADAGAGRIAKTSASNRATIMNIRIRKSAAEALTTQKTSEEAFARAAQVSTCLGPISDSGTVRIWDLGNPDMDEANRIPLGDIPVTHGKK